MRPIGGRLSRGDGEGLSSADLPSQPPLSVEETGPAQEETPGLVSVSACPWPRYSVCASVFVNVSACHPCVIICCPFGCHGKIHWCLCLFMFSPSHGHSWRWNQLLLCHLQGLSLPFCFWLSNSHHIHAFRYCLNYVFICITLLEFQCDFEYQSHR